MEDYRQFVANYIDENDPANGIVFEALDFAAELHAGQRRKSNEPYIIHPLAVAQILAQDLNVKDPYLIAAALLHDVVEDVARVTLADIEQRFGNLVAELVDGCTKMKRQRLDRTTLSDLTHSKIFLSSSRQIGVLIIKLADRLHNIKTLRWLPRAKQRRIAQETVEVYAPLAGKLNLYPLKRELYQLALPYLYPKKSKKIVHATHHLLDSPEVFEIQQKLRDVFSSFISAVNIRPRVKSLGAYYSPVKRTLDLNNIENRVDFTIILDTDDILSCYTALGMVTNLFTLVPRSIRDLIATPRSNGYQSLHIRINLSGQEFLVKIRTQPMDAAARAGILHQWSFNRPRSHRYWKEISELFRSLGEYSGSAPQRKDLIRLSGTEETFVYTPTGDIHYLPAASIVLDFAYKIHSNLGDLCRGAEINGQWAPITRMLKDGDTVKVFTADTPFDADSDLERLCKTPKARNAVNKNLNRRRRSHAEKIGKNILLQELKRAGLSESVLDGETIRLFMDFKSIKDRSQMFIRIGQDMISPLEVTYYFESGGIAPGHPRQHVPDPVPLSQRSLRNRLLVGEMIHGIHKFSNCCRPYPGQIHLVAVLSERGVAFHHRDCQELSTRHRLDPARLLIVEWDHRRVWTKPLLFETRISDMSLTQTVSRLGPATVSIPIHRMEAANGKHTHTMISLTLADYQQSKAFFSCFEPGTVIIDRFMRADDGS